MAVVNGNAGKNFIHRLGDGLVPPAGFGDITSATIGDDTINGFAGDDIIFGDAGNNSLLGGAGNDQLNGGNGNDYLDGGAGDDAMAGGDGNDTYIVNSIGDTVTEAAAGGTDTVKSSITYTLGANLENLILIGVGNINGTGNAGNNIITGNAGNNTLNGGAGNDTLRGGLGLDTLIGGTGNDTIIIDLTGGNTDIANAGGQAGDKLVLVGNASFEGKVEVDLALVDQLTSDTRNQSGFNSVDASALFGLFSAVLYGNSGNNTIVGTSHSDNLFGLDGNDTLAGGVGGDFLTGGSGLDRMFGGPGRDTFFIGSQSDIVAGEVYSGGDGYDTLHGLGAAAIDLTGLAFTSIEEIDGFAGGVTLTAGQLDGLAGVTPIGTITLSGPGNADISDASSIADGILFQLSDDGNGLTLESHGRNDVRGGAGADTVTFVDNFFGPGQINNVEGNGGNDALTGANSNDYLTGGAGNDTLTGGSGADWFIYTGAANGADIVTDFSGTTKFGGGAGEGDKLTFQGLLQGTFEYRGSQAFRIDGNTQARVAGGKVFMDIDGNGVSDMTITLTGLTNANQLVAGDFQFV